MGLPTSSTVGGSTAERTGPALVYFAKAPRPGLVKTRLSPPLTPAEAAGLYRGFLEDLVRPFPEPGSTAYLYGWPEDSLAEFEWLQLGPVEVRAQRGPDLGSRLIACFAELFAAGHDRVVVRNTDSPDLPGQRVAEGLAACRPGRVVLGPDPGGGYYLVGLAEPQPELFEPLLADSAAAASGVFAATSGRAADLGLEVHSLPSEPDVDEFDDLLAMWRRRGSADR